MTIDFEYTSALIDFVRTSDPTTDHLKVEVDRVILAMSVGTGDRR
jgi:hypothetical protein